MKAVGLGGAGRRSIAFAPCQSMMPEGGPGPMTDDVVPGAQFRRGAVTARQSPKARWSLFWVA
jgi:hypothetical protein